MRDDLVLLQKLPGNFYNFHPGSHTGQGMDMGVQQIAEGLARVIREAEELSGMPLGNRILLETMAGKGSEVGGRFEELKAIIDIAGELLGGDQTETAKLLGGDQTESAKLLGGDQTETAKLGVCLDTCHIWDGGYDIAGGLDGVLEEFDRKIGLKLLCAVHLNDSKNPCGSRKDRHEKLCLGMIGEEALKAVVRHPLLQGKPFILETPNDDEGYRREISLVKEWMEY